METENKPELSRILNKYYENLEQLKQILSAKEYRKALATITVYYLMEIYDNKGIKYSRQDLMTKTNIILERNNMETYSYFFYRQFC